MIDVRRLTMTKNETKNKSKNKTLARNRRGCDIHPGSPYQMLYDFYRFQL